MLTKIRLARFVLAHGKLSPDRHLGPKRTRLVMRAFLMSPAPSQEYVSSRASDLLFPIPPWFSHFLLLPNLQQGGFL
jgi:hypothetical protein